MPDSAPPKPLKQNYWTILGRALRLRCPRCGQGKLFSGWFSMIERCPDCGLPFQREPGFYLGSIYFNYGIVAVILAIAFPTILLTGAVSAEWLLLLLSLFCIFFALWFFRYARSLWLAFDQYWDPSSDQTQK